MAVLFRLQAAIVLSCVALASSSGVSTQFHAQDGIGQYSYGYSGGPSAKTETKTADGVVRGQYSYVDAHGIIQTAVYVADPVHGFRVAATNDPAVSQHAAVHHAPVVAAPVPAYHGPVAGYHLPPGVDTPEVQIAKSAHFQAVAEAKARNAHASYSAYYPAGAAYVPYAAAHSHPGYYTQVKDTPEVAAAKSAHFAAVHEAKARAHAAIPYQDYHHSNYASGYYGYYVPVPVKDTPEVAAAKAAHFAAVHEAKSRVNHAYSHEGAYYPYASGYAAYAPLPVKDTPEVAAAKAAHFAAVHEAKARTAHAGSYYPYAAAHSYYAPLPVGDTPEVAAAKAAHYAAVHEAKARNHYAAHYDAPTHYSNYVPLPVTDTPEVAHAKAAHLAAVHHAKAAHWW